MNFTFCVIIWQISNWSYLYTSSENNIVIIKNSIWWYLKVFLLFKRITFFVHLKRSQIRSFKKKMIGALLKTCSGLDFREFHGKKMVRWLFENKVFWTTILTKKLTTVSAPLLISSLLQLIYFSLIIILLVWFT